MSLRHERERERLVRVREDDSPGGYLGESWQRAAKQDVVEIYPTCRSVPM